LDALDLGEGLDAGLDLGGFVRLGAESVDELLGFGDFAILIDLLLPEVVLSILELGLVGRVVPRKFLGTAVMEGDSAGGETVHH